jgi:pyruvate ferredoxin oxidoreductase beta subunit
VALQVVILNYAGFLQETKMAINLKELSKKPDILASGHRACAGCTAPTVLRMVTNCAQYPIVTIFATGCMEVSTTIYPYTSWTIPYIHSAFENAAATTSGVVAAYKAMLRKGTIKDKIRFITFGGDGGTYDIGLQSLSGALERGNQMLYVCYDNEAYMNTGIQRSGSTPMCAHTTTAPVGSVKKGKEQFKKDLTAIVAAHHIPFAAQAAVHNWRDLMTKVQKALEIDGPTFINVLAPCHRGWRIPIEEGIEYSRLATDTCYWPLYEIDDGKVTINYKPKVKRPIGDYMLKQGRFGHLAKPENAALLKSIQERVDRNWEELLLREASARTRS